MGSSPTRPTSQQLRADIRAVSAQEVLQERQVRRVAINILRARLNKYDESHSWKLDGVDLSGADLRDANLASAFLHFGNLAEADLSGSLLAHAEFTAGNLSGASLRKATLWEATLSSVNLFGADLTGADLIGADLCSTDLHEVKVEGADFRGVMWSSRTRWPEVVFERIRAASVELDESDDFHGTLYVVEPVDAFDKLVNIDTVPRSQFQKLFNARASQRIMVP